MIPCFAGGGRRWKPQHLKREGEDWIPVEKSAQAAQPRVSTGPDSDMVECDFYLNHDIVSAPVMDRAMETGFVVKRVTSAVLRIIPAQYYHECWDQLLLISAWVQLVASCWHLFWLITLSTYWLLFEGELLTLMWHWSRATSALLVIHKKMHARWFSDMHDLTSIHREHLCGCLGYVLRSPTPVSLLIKATAVKTPTPPPFKSVYAECYKLQVRDSVRVTKFLHNRRGTIGTILACDVGETTQLGFYRGELYTVDFGNFTEQFSSVELSLVDEAKRSAQIPVWRDRLTPYVFLSLVICWLAGGICLILFSGFMSDKHGDIILRFQAPMEREPLSDWTLGFVLLVQLLCIFLETFFRFVVWLFIALTTAFCYA